MFSEEAQPRIKVLLDKIQWKRESTSTRYLEEKVGNVLKFLVVIGF